MPIEKQMVMVRPNWDLATQYGSYWLGQTKIELIDRGMLITDLASDFATKSDLLVALSQIDPLIVWLMGHGNEIQIAGQDNYVVLEKGIDEALMVGRVVHLTACLTGVEGGLLQSLVNAGAIAGFGYSVDLIVGVDSGNFSVAPDNDATKSLMSADIAIETALAVGASCADAFKASDNKADAEIEYWRASRHPDADLLIFCHIHNKDGKVLYGEGGAIVRATLPYISPVLLYGIIGTSTVACLGAIQMLSKGGKIGG